MIKILLTLSLLSLIGCSSSGTRDVASHKEKDDKKVWTCGILPKVERVEIISEANDRVEVYQSKDKYKLIGFGSLKKVNASEGQGVFSLIGAADKDEEYKPNEELYKNTKGDSLHIHAEAKIEPKPATFHVSGADYDIQCQAVK